MLITREQLERFFDQHCTKEEADRIAKYLEENPQVLRKYILQDWKEVDGDAPLPAEFSEEMLTAIRRDIFPAGKIMGKPSLVRRYIPWTAAAMILLIAGLILLRRDNSQGPQVLARTIKTPDTVTGPLLAWQVKINHTARDLSLALSDGSVVSLSPGSTLRYREPFEEDQRAVSLDGQASFKVVKDLTRPFRVTAGPILTTVLGTEFNVSESRTGVRVRLYSGKVKLQAKDSTLKGWQDDIVLLPGEQMTYLAKQDLVEVSGFEKIGASRAALPEHHVSPKEPQDSYEALVFDKKRLPEVMDQLAAYYHTHLTYDRRQLGGLYFTGTVLKTDSLLTILELITNRNELIIVQQPGGYSIQKNIP